jgi:hypothetical protein
MQDEEIINKGFLRIVRLLSSMIDSADEQDKSRLMKLSDNLNNDLGDFVALLYEEAGVDDDDIANFRENEVMIIQQNKENEEDVESDK